MTEVRKKTLELHIVALIAACLGLCPTRQAFADAAITEFSLGAGFTETLIRRPPKNAFDEGKSYNVSGPTVVGGATVYQTDRIVARLVLNTLIDFNDSTVVRYGAAGALGYHVWGGALSRTQSFPGASVTTLSDQCVTVLLQPALNSYAFPDTSNNSKPLKATVLETSVGGEYSHRLGAETSLSAVVLGSLKSFYVSGDQISIKSFDLLINWRVSI